MSKKFQVNDELAAVEAALSSLEPGTSNINRDRMMFLAGRASVSDRAPPPVRHVLQLLWPITSAVSLFIALCFGSMYFFLSSNRIEKQIVYVEVDKASDGTNASQKLWYDNVKLETAKIESPRSTPGIEGMDYLSLSRLIAAKGVEAVPLPKIGLLAPIDLPPNRPATLRDWDMYLNNN
jgi:hypothetical protein